MITHSTLLAFDFDGTLAPICDDPASVRLPRAAMALLAEAAALRGVAVAVVSGRDVDDLVRRIQLPGLYLIGSHGLEIRAPGGILVRGAPPLRAEVDVDLRTAALAAGLRLETKKHALTLHWRGQRDEAAAPIAERFRAWARAHELDVIEGRCVVEARCAGAGKAEALRWLSSALATPRILYAGDDVTDFEALHFAARSGRGVFVASAERAAPPGVTVVQSFLELFRLVRQEVMI
jgi:alpha,alpha-trehalase